MSQLTFANGDAMPAVGLGTWKAGAREVGAAVCTALEVGYRHIDCAAIYGNEAEIGHALREAFAAGGPSREQLWITSKLWNDCHAPEQVRPALERSLADLGLEWLDLYLIHWPVAHRHGVLMPSQGRDLVSLAEQPLAATWAAMEELVEAGLVRHIGVSNMGIAKLEQLMATARIRPEHNQVERHPYLQQNALLEFCHQHSIGVTAYAPLGSPPSGSPPSGTPSPESPASLFTDPVITAIAKAHGASPSQVLLAWGLATGTAVIPKSVHRDRLVSNLAASQLQLTPADLEAIASCDRHSRFIDGRAWVVEGGPYTLANLWDEP